LHEHQYPPHSVVGSDHELSILRHSLEGDIDAPKGPYEMSRKIDETAVTFDGEDKFVAL